MNTLNTQRLVLEPLDEEHFEIFHRLNTDPFVMRYISEDLVTEERSKQYISFAKSNWELLGFSTWVIKERKSDVIVGTCGIQHIEFIDENPIEMGWRLFPEKWGCGYAVEAAHCMRNFAFNNLGLDYVYAVCHQENFNSRNVMKKLGMQFEGISRYYGMDVLTYVSYRMNSNRTMSVASSLIERNFTTAAQDQV